MEISHTSLCLEFVVLYVKEAITENNSHSLNAYGEWSTKVQDPNYIDSQEMALAYLHALMLFRSGVRRCNTEAVYGSFSKFAHLLLTKTFYF